MKKHIKNFMKFYGYGEQDMIFCFVCGKQSVDVHHVQKRSQMGSDEVTNLCGLCRECHDKAHKSEIPQDFLQKKVNREIEKRIKHLTK